MNTKEFRKLIAESDSAEWFNKVEIQVDYPASNFSQNFKGFGDLHRFLEQQSNGWKKLANNLPNELAKSEWHFSKLKEKLENFINSTSNPHGNYIESRWRNEKDDFKGNKDFLTYDSPESSFLLEVHDKFPNSLSGAYGLMTGNYNLKNRDEFVGAMMSYEFLLKDHTEIVQRRDKEKSSISRLRNDLRSQVSEMEAQVGEHLKNSVQKYSAYVAEMDTFKEEKQKLFDDWFTKSKAGFKAFDTDAAKKIQDLEKTYEEKLRLEKPAEYWHLRAAKLKKEGWKSIYWLIGLVAFACLTLYLLLWLTPEGMLLSFKTNQSGAIKWSVIYITFLSFLAFGIRALNKVAFSSFHLARDAEEREQLTYVYLSLIKGSAVNEKEKNLIIQSLFSRADTGLLKEDSSPTMPNDIAGKIFGKS